MRILVLIAILLALSGCGMSHYPDWAHDALKRTADGPGAS